MILLGRPVPVGCLAAVGSLKPLVGITKICLQAYQLSHRWQSCPHLGAGVGDRDMSEILADLSLGGALISS